MKQKRVWRYYCDFCGKSGCNKASIKKHEMHCTMNPNRICRMCELMEWEQQPIEKLKKSIVKIKDEKQVDDGFITGIIPAEYNIEKLKDISNGCPACIMSALRQSGINLAWVGFDYQKSVEEFFVEYNNKGYEYGLY